MVAVVQREQARHATGRPWSHPRSCPYLRRSRDDTRTGHSFRASRFTVSRGRPPSPLSLHDRRSMVPPTLSPPVSPLSGIPPPSHALVHISLVASRWDRRRSPWPPLTSRPLQAGLPLRVFAWAVRPRGASGSARCSPYPTRSWLVPRSSSWPSPCHVGTRLHRLSHRSRASTAVPCPRHLQVLTRLRSLHSPDRASLVAAAADVYGGGILVLGYHG